MPYSKCVIKDNLKKRLKITMDSLLNSQSTRNTTKFLISYQTATYVNKRELNVLLLLQFVNLVNGNEITVEYRSLPPTPIRLIPESKRDSAIHDVKLHLCYTTTVAWNLKFLTTFAATII